MRRREISPEFWTDEKVVSVSDGAKLLFQGLWNLADREGRLEDRPLVIGFKVRPWDPTAASRYLDELVGAKLVVRYEVGDERYLLVPNFCEHQHVHPKEVPSRIPPPGGWPENPGKTGLTRAKPGKTGHAVEFPDLPGNADTCRAGSSFPSGSSGSSFEKPLSTDVDREPPVEVSEVEPAQALQAGQPEDFDTPPTTPVAGDTEDAPEAKPEASGASPAKQVFEYWVKAARKGSNAVFGAKRKKAVKARLAQGYTVDDLCRAVDGCLATPFNRGVNEGGVVYDDLELICRSESHVDRFRQAAKAQPRRAFTNGFDPNAGITTRPSETSPCAGCGKPAETTCWDDQVCYSCFGEWQRAGPGARPSVTESMAADTHAFFSSLKSGVSTRAPNAVN